MKILYTDDETLQFLAMCILQSSKYIEMRNPPPKYLDPKIQRELQQHVKLYDKIKYANEPYNLNANHTIQLFLEKEDDE